VVVLPVPKNDKPEGQMRRWMYVYFAVDVYTYDLLHIAIYLPQQESAQAFLLALRAKGYHPRVIVIDLRRDYAPLIAQVFPQAQHHECIFHALQRVKEKIVKIFQACTKRTAQKRY
jgi:transposase-like protein